MTVVAAATLDSYSRVPGGLELNMDQLEEAPNVVTGGLVTTQEDRSVRLLGDPVLTTQNAR